MFFKNPTLLCWLQTWNRSTKGTRMVKTCVCCFARNTLGLLELKKTKKNKWTHQDLILLHRCSYIVSYCTVCYSILQCVFMKEQRECCYIITVHYVTIVVRVLIWNKMLQYALFSPPLFSLAVTFTKLKGKKPQPWYLVTLTFAACFNAQRRSNECVECFRPFF